ncbi:dihydrodipicolinate synthase family protein [Parathalassolituus penaei]|uniref:Dihydrodipicolinate synthase family protein n=1 Tax=Parathalassolituus penaei TaxID=2997323 RepID=A0A9X3ITA8_9GAMM|nr:dihydrodipicolinate synthase family protein [Parathalassolituus penaei]MCY0967297.1 dihydrodipicolinate synthase family protein [Parathalassolituus penaei]
MFFNGIYTPVITPFGSDEKIDFDAYSKHVGYLQESGVHGLMIGGTTGEYYVESHEERVELLKVARSVVGADMQIIFGTGSLDPNASVRLAEAGAQHGATALLVGTPPYSLPTQQELADTALTIDKAADLPIMLYNYPARMGVNMETGFFDRVFSHSSNFKGIKESSGDINRLHMLVNSYPELEVACGMDDQALEFFAWGAQSWVCAGSNFLPRQHVALYEACVKANDFNKARRIMAAMMPLMQVLEQGGKFIQSVKYGVELNGGPVVNVRRPLQGLSESDKEQVAAVISQLQANIDQILAAPSV